MSSNCNGCSPAVVRERRDHARLLASSMVLFIAIGGIARVSCAATLSRVGEIVPGYFSSTQTTDMPTADFDGDGLQDIVVLGNREFSDLLRIVGVQSGDGWKIKQTIVPDGGDVTSTGPSIATWTDAAGPHLLYARSNSVSQYGGWPLTLERIFSLGILNEVYDAQIGDVDNDGSLELVVTGYSPTGPKLRGISLSTGAELWAVGIPSNFFENLHLAQLDADPALEIILTGRPGSVIDGATHALEWQYKDGMGPLIEHGRFGGAFPRFASIGYQLVMFQGAPWSPLWDLVDINAYASAVFDVDGDQIDELLCSCNAFPSGTRVFDVQTHEVRSSFEDGASMQLAAADFDGDLAAEIAIGRSPGQTFVDGSSFSILDANSGATEFEIPVQAVGPFISGGYIGVDGARDVVFGSSSGFILAGTIGRADSMDGTVRWQIPASDASTSLYRVKNLEVTQLEGQAQPVIFASGDSFHSGQSAIVALRSSDGSLLWGIDSANNELPDHVSIGAMAMIDRDGNALTDAVLICTSESRLRLFDTASRTQIWSSVAMPGYCRGTLQMPSNGNLQLVAVLPGELRAYDAQTHMLSWSLPVDVEGASYLPQGANGPEIAVFNAYRIQFYDADSRALLRELVFPQTGSLNAVTQPPGASIHDLVVSITDRLHVLDGVSGSVGPSSDPIGRNAGLFNKLTAIGNSDGSVLVGSGSDVVVSTFRLDGLSDGIFANGFEPRSIVP